MIYCEKRNKEVVEWWLFCEKFRKKICLPCAKRKRKHSGKERKEANNDIVRVQHEKRKRKDGNKEN